MKSRLISVSFVTGIVLSIVFGACSEVALNTKKLSFTVSFESNGGSSVAAIQVASGEKAIKPADPIRWGFTFAGWYTESTLTHVFDFATETITQDITLYAKWSTATYAVTFKRGSLPDSIITVTHGDRITEPTDIPLQTGGYSFAGWYKESTSTNVFDFTAAVTANMTVYARWLDYVVTMHGDTIASITPRGAFVTVIDIPSKINGISIKGIEGNHASNTGVFGRAAAGYITSVSLPGTLTSIGEDAFYGGTAMQSITIPASVTTIGDDAFSGCSSLANVRIEATTPPRAGVNMFANTPFALVVRVPNESVSAYKGVANWSAYENMLYGYDGKVVPKLVWTHIDGTKRYANVPADGVLLSSVLTSKKEDIQSVDFIPNGVTSIGGNAFERCVALTSIAIPSSVTTMRYRAFWGCTALTTIAIPNSIKRIAEDAFFNCTSLTSVSIPDGVTSIGITAFEDCTGLTRISIPNTVVDIGVAAFQGCTGLTEVTLPHGLTTIAESAFENCTGLTRISIPNGVTSIGVTAFRGCTGLTEVTLPDKLTLVDDYAFTTCTALTKVTLPHGLVSIGDAAFKGCTGLTGISIPNTVTSIGISALLGCTSLTDITIPSSITDMGGAAFYDCSALANVRMEATTPPRVGTDMFVNTPTSLAIRVPSASVNAYKNATNWSAYANQITGY